jgi:hypothetical protein
VSIEICMCSSFGCCTVVRDREVLRSCAVSSAMQNTQVLTQAKHLYSSSSSSSSSSYTSTAV